jgi:hypothetical protein
MKSSLLSVWLTCIAIYLPAPAFAGPDQFSFAVIAHLFTKKTDESSLRNAIAETDADNLAFVVANGIKSHTEPCTDQIYARRKALLEEAQNGLILSLAASDWADCRINDGRSAAIERLNRIRELFFVDEFSFGSARVPLVRQSLMPKFRSYGENARWRIGDILFATINLPANNNRYLSAAGRNSEFEDRLIANRAWLEQLFNTAARKRLKAVVIFSDGNPLAKSTSSSLFSLHRKRDGFTEIRRQLTALASGFKGKTLIIHGQAAGEDPSPNDIVWRNNLGQLEVGSDWTKITFNSSSPSLFSVTADTATPKKTAQ